MGPAPPTIPGVLGAPPALPGPAFQIGAEGVLVSDRPCIVCSYNLRGLSPASHCPECGTPVGHSLRGNLFRHCSPGYLAGLHRGVFLILTAIIVKMFLVIGAVVGLAFAGLTPTAGGEIFDLLGSLAVAAMSLYGWWLFSALDPGHSALDTGANSRRVIRITVIAMAFTELGSFTAWLLARAMGPTGILNFLATATDLVSLLAFVVLYFATLRYLRWIARRIPSERVFQRARTLMWLGPLLATVGAIVLGLGPLFALILFWNLLDWVRRDLKAIRAAQDRAPRQIDVASTPAPPATGTPGLPSAPSPAGTSGCP